MILRVRDYICIESEKNLPTEEKDWNYHNNISFCFAYNFNYKHGLPMLEYDNDDTPYPRYYKIVPGGDPHFCNRAMLINREVYVEGVQDIIQEYKGIIQNLERVLIRV